MASSTVLSHFRLDGKVALVTGATKNIGLEIARGFCEAGATVVMVARDPDLLDRRRAEITADGGTALAIAADISTPEGRQRVIDTVNDEFSQVHVLVNGVHAIGDSYAHPPLEMPDAVWDQVVPSNVVAPYRLSAAFGQRMLGGGGGSIINILSGAGLQPGPAGMPYGATKSALWMMTRYLAFQCAPKIRVNAIAPGLTMSDTGGPQASDGTQRIIDQTPMGRAAHPSEIAPAALYLASDASSYTTGALLVVNGGRHW
jgi:NAD(P)-dependent dehydrogenase (short-subunit alcohol dehydrogenase family)